MPQDSSYYKRLADELRKANLPEDDISMAIAAEMETQGEPSLATEQPLARQALNFATGIAPIAGAVSGGLGAARLASQYAPKIPGPVASGMGQAAGYLAGSVPNIARGLQTLPEAAKESIGVGLVGGGSEAAMNALTRILGSMGGVQQRAITQGLRSPSTMFRSPGEVGEATLGGKIVEAVGPQQGLTEGRLATQKTLADLQARGQMVDISDTMNELNTRIKALQKGGIGPDSRVALTRLKAIRDDIDTKYLQQSYGAPPKVAVTPNEADSINAQIQDAVGNAFGKPGGREVVRNLKAVSHAHTESFRVQTGTAESAAATKARMDAIEGLREQISAKSPETFVRSVGDAIMTKGESGDQTALMALREFDRSGKWEDQIRKLASMRQWTGTESRIAHNIRFEFLRRLPRLVAKVTGSLVRPAGATGGAAAAAFSRAFDPLNYQPQKPVPYK